MDYSSEQTTSPNCSPKKAPKTKIPFTIFSTNSMSDLEVTFEDDAIIINTIKKK